MLTHGAPLVLTGEGPGKGGGDKKGEQQKRKAEGGTQGKIVTGGLGEKWRT